MDVYVSVKLSQLGPQTSFDKLWFLCVLSSRSNQLRIPHCQVNSIWLDQSYTMEFLQALVHFSVISWVWYKKQWPNLGLKHFAILFSSFCVSWFFFKWLKWLIVRPWFVSSLGWTNIYLLNQACIGVIWLKNFHKAPFYVL